MLEEEIFLQNLPSIIVAHALGTHYRDQSPYVVVSSFRIVSHSVKTTITTLAFQFLQSSICIMVFLYLYYSYDLIIIVMDASFHRNQLAVTYCDHLRAFNELFNR